MSLLDFEWYHGSRESNLEELEANNPRYEGSLGYGVYLTADRHHASVYGRNIYTANLREVGIPEDSIFLFEENRHFYDVDCEALGSATPGARAFAFRIKDRNSGEEYLYSVLGHCEEEVRNEEAKRVLRDSDISALFQEQHPTAISDFRSHIESIVGSPIPQKVKDCLNQIWQNTLDHMAENPDTDLQYDWDDEIGNDLYDSLEGRIPEEQLEAIFDSFEQRLAPALAETYENLLDVDSLLGDVIDFEDLSATIEEHGYSAFYIDNHNIHGDELVVFDEKYLPIPVSPAGS